MHILGGKPREKGGILSEKRLKRKQQQRRREKIERDKGAIYPSLMGKALSGGRS